VLGAASAASAGVCQTQSSVFFETKTCGNPSRGYGKGILAFGQQGLEVSSTGISGGLSSVGARGINSGGSSLPNCWILDTTEDGQPAFVIGGECNNAVKFWLQINY